MISLWTVPLKEWVVLQSCAGTHYFCSNCRIEIKYGEKRVIQKCSHGHSETFLKNADKFFHKKLEYSTVPSHTVQIVKILAANKFEQRKEDVYKVCINN